MRVAMFLFAAGWAAAQPAADLVLLNAKVWTVNPAQPAAQAVAVMGERIRAVGNTEEVRRWVGPKTEVLDLGGRLVLPGFNDAHVHFYTGGRNLASVQLRDARSREEFRERLRAFAARQPRGRWILGGDWDHENWRPAALPERGWIDDVTPEHPVFVNRLDGHMALANSLALRLAGITREMPDPPGGAIVRDERGEPTGVLKDAAMARVARVIPPPGERELAEAIRAALRHAAENGVTSVQDMSASPEILGVYQELRRRGELTVRIYAVQPLAAWERLARVGVRAGFGDARLKIGGLKAFADGSLGSTTALFFAPYADAPGTAGLAADDMIPEEKLRKRVAGADRAGLQVMVHAIGDRANQTVLRLFEAVGKENGARDRRFRIEHAQHLRAEEIPLFGKLGVVASMQPYHAIDDGRWAEDRIGAERARGSYAFRSLLDSGAVLAFGSDWYVAPLEPLMGIYAAVTRATLDGKRPEGWIPEQKIGVGEAIRAFTMGSAYASFEEDEKGSIEPGKLADMVVLSDDILSIAPEAIAKARVEITIFNGKVIYRRPSATAP